MTRREFSRLAALAPLAPAAKPSTAATVKPLIVLPESNQIHEIGHGEARIIVGGEQSGGAWWLAKLSSEPGRKTSLHVHFSADEQFYVLEGVLSAWLDGNWIDLPAGAVMTAPHGVPHALGNRGEQPVSFLASGNPVGLRNTSLTWRHSPRVLLTQAPSSWKS